MYTGDTANRPRFRLKGPADLPPDLRMMTGELTLSGPSEKLDAAHWPVRGDLAHIRLAGRCFVPHYAVPMPHVVKAPGATLRKLGQAQADTLATLHEGEGFDVLDMSGGWCWGQVALNGPGGCIDAGLVGYISHHLLAPVTIGTANT